MRAPQLILRTLVAVVVSVLLLAAVASLPPGTSEYRDPEGRFVVPVPLSWTVVDDGGLVRLRGPEGDVDVTIAVLDGRDARAAIDAAWLSIVASVPAGGEAVDLPPELLGGGIDEYVQVVYARGEDGSVQMAQGRRADGRVFVLLFRAEVEAWQRRTAQLEVIAGGLRILPPAAPGAGPLRAQPVDAPLLAELEIFIAQRMVQLDTAGAAVAIVQGGRLVYSRGFGVRDVASGAPMTPETLVLIGSVTKPLTTMMMAGLVDEGVVAWDTLAVDILPSFRLNDPGLTRSMTLEQLVCACTGIPRRDLEWLFNADGLGAEGVIASLREFEAFTAAGEAFQYSNQLVATGGYLAALAAGGRPDHLYEDFVATFERRVLEPMGMSSSTFSFDEAAASRDRATPYAADVKGTQLPLPLSIERTLEPLGPAAGLWSNAADLANVLVTLLDGGVTASGRQVASAGGLAHTWEPRIAMSAATSYGLGWVVQESGRLRIISHAGNTFGFTAELAFVPELDVGIVVLSNQQDSVLNLAVRARFLELLLRRSSAVDPWLDSYLELRATSLVEFRAGLQAEVDPAAVAPYLGTFHNDALGDVALRFEGGRLLFDVGEFVSEICAHSDDDSFTSYSCASPPLAGFELKLERTDDGSPVLRLGEGLIEYLFERVP